MYHLGFVVALICIWL